MNAKEMRDLYESELDEHVRKLRKDLFGLRFANATGELEDTAGIRRTRRELARALTIVGERAQAGSNGAARPGRTANDG